MHNKWILLNIFFFGLFFQASATINIKKIHGINSATLGSTTTLTCDYYVENEEEVVLKWFYNDTVQISQWIPDISEAKPLGPFKDKMSAHENSITFPQTTRDLTGYYTCTVMSLTNEASKTEIMVVHKRPKMTKLSERISKDTWICAAYEVYPKPQITISGSHDAGQQIIPIEETEDIVETEDDFYDVTKTAKFDSAGVQSPIKITCKIHIPHTTYTGISIMSRKRID